MTHPSRVEELRGRGAVLPVQGRQATQPHLHQALSRKPDPSPRPPGQQHPNQRLPPTHAWAPAGTSQPEMPLLWLPSPSPIPGSQVQTLPPPARGLPQLPQCLAFLSSWHSGPKLGPVRGSNKVTWNPPSCSSNASQTGRFQKSQVQLLTLREEGTVHPIPQVPQLL